MHSHAIVWIDSREAHVFRFSTDDVECQRIKAHSPFRKIHHKAGVIGAGRQSMDLDFFDRTIDALRGTRQWLLVGPGNAKNELLAHIERHMPWLKVQLAGVEPMDHPTDGELLQRARHAFRALDRMQPNSPPAAA